MVTLKSARELEIMARAGDILARTLARLRAIVRPGMTTEDLDAEAEAFIRSHKGARPSFKGLYGFPKTLCVSVDATARMLSARVGSVARLITAPEFSVMMSLPVLAFISVNDVTVDISFRFSRLSNSMRLLQPPPCVCLDGETSIGE